jgi:hypothetical protein
MITKNQLFLNIKFLFYLVFTFKVGEVFRYKNKNLYKKEGEKEGVANKYIVSLAHLEN